MSDSAPIAAVRHVHESTWDPAVAQDTTPGGVHQGCDSVVNGFSGPLFGFHPVVEEFCAYGDHGSARRHEGTTKTGKEDQVRFIHLWTVRGGELARQAAGGLVVDHNG